MHVFVMNSTKQYLHRHIHKGFFYKNIKNSKTIKKMLHNCHNMNCKFISHLTPKVAKNVFIKL